MLAVEHARCEESEWSGAKVRAWRAAARAVRGLICAHSASGSMRARKRAGCLPRSSSARLRSVTSHAERRVNTHTESQSRAVLTTTDCRPPPLPTCSPRTAASGPRAQVWDSRPRRASTLSKKILLFTRRKISKRVYLLSFFALQIIVGQATLLWERIKSLLLMSLSLFHFKTFAFVDLSFVVCVDDFVNCDALCTECEWVEG